MNKTPVSFEFFPPKTDLGAEKLIVVHEELCALNPVYFSVTYGAGGSTRDRTLNTIDSIQGKEVNGRIVPVAPHLSCIGDDKGKILELLERYKAQGINRIVALRGDLPSGQVGLGELPYARDLVAFIRESTGDHFHIEVAAYPEVHPQAQNFTQDINHFVAKVNAGASSAITQYFYNPESYFYFMDEIAKQGVTIPVLAGIMPITSATNLLRFSDSCGADVPRWVRKRLADYGDDIKSIQAFGHEVVVNLCEKLIAGGVPAFHFYTMNQTEATKKLVLDLGLA